MQSRSTCSLVASSSLATYMFGQQQVNPAVLGGMGDETITLHILRPGSAAGAGVFEEERGSSDHCAFGISALCRLMPLHSIPW